MKKLRVVIQQIGQLQNITFDFAQPINLIYAENGTGKTTLSRIFNAVSKRKLTPTLAQLSTVESTCTFEVNNKARTVFAEQKWSGDDLHFEVFNTDYYRRNLVNLIGSQAYIGGEELNSLRHYLQIWQLLFELNNCENSEQYWSFIASNLCLTEALHITTISPFLDWYQPTNNIASQKKQQQLLTKKAHEMYVFADENIIDKLNLIAVVKFVNQCGFAFPTSLARIKPQHYLKLRSGSRVKEQIDQKVPEWIFWKLVMVYQLLTSFEKAYNLLPSSITNHHPFTANVDDTKAHHFLTNILTNEQISGNDEKINLFIQILGLGLKYQVKNNQLFHFSSHESVRYVSESENKLLSLAFFFTCLSMKDLSQYQAIVIDDPINSMDANHSLNLARLISNLAKNEKFSLCQWIILTHNVNFADNLMHRFTNDKLDESYQLTSMYLDNQFATRIFKYPHRFNSVIKRVILDIYEMSQNPKTTSLVDIANKTRILLEIYSSIYSGSGNHYKLIEDPSVFSEQERQSFQNVMDLLNNFSHGSAMTMTNISYNISQTTIANILHFVIKLIKVYSPLIWKQVSRYHH